MRINNGKKRKGFVTALALSLLASLSLAGPASALPKPPTPSPGGGESAGPGGGSESEGPGDEDTAVLPAVGNINVAKLGDLHIHKFQAPEWDAAQNPNNGTELTAPQDAVPLAGVTFTVKKIDGIDLTKSADWVKLQTLKATADGTGVSGAEGATVGAQVGTGSTLADGSVNFSGLAVGAYLVTETSAPENVSKKVAPFIVTMPYPTDGKAKGNVDGWLYDVHVYPKNEVTNKPTKEVATDTPTLSIGSDIKWSLTVPVPATVKDYISFKVTDQLDPKIQLSTANTTVIKIGDDTLDAAKYDVTGTDKGALVTFDFAKALAEINAAKGKTMTIDFYTTVMEKPDQNQVPNNDFKIVYDNGDGETQVPPNPGTDTPVAYFGDLQILKVSKVGEKPLKGAKFGIYASREDAEAGKSVIKEVVSGDNGKVLFEALYRGSSVDASKKYFIKELEAPAGFKADTEVKEVTITADTGKADDLQVDNTPYTPGDVPDLPLTGAAGKVLLIFAGVAIVAISVGTAFVTRRRKDNI